MLTLRQIEVIRAIMVTGTVGGAARLLNVSSPGISRVMKHSEAAIGIKLFIRKGGRYAPTPEASTIFRQINGVYDKVEDLQGVIDRLKLGTNVALRVGSVPSLSNVMVPRAIADVRHAFPGLQLEVDVLRIEEAVDFLLLEKGEAVALSDTLDHPMLECEPLATGRLKCIVPLGHPLAQRARISADTIVKHPLIGLDPNDPYGRIMAGIFADRRLDYQVVAKARFGTTVCALVTHGVGIAIVDEFTLAGGYWPGIRAIDIAEPTDFQTHIAYRKDAARSRYCDRFVKALRTRMNEDRLAPAKSGSRAGALRQKVT